ncbi:hypothetical protein I6J32_02390 [Moraxella osloensis]|nr:virulence factor TspB C-terminal domain-related protein [Moraxella osloensis]QRO13722.1 hypothetical protein I6J32_02310 [Moraxella osloensis]QRO13730.1 hypothetical protein I6J32_02350 [Moraxella osloensis]QRO13738.1 hypothetical protein I6J32_02390 [Moraxella osloensis]
MKTIIKKILMIYISLVLIFAPSSIVYAASPSGWSFSAFDVATSVLTAMKNGGTAAVTVAKSPISQKIAKGIVGGVIVGAALPLAISQITGIALTSLDWVLDPANNAIKYKDKNVTSGTWYYVAAYGQSVGGYTMQEACDAVAKLRWRGLNVSGVWKGSQGCLVTGDKNEWLPYGFESITKTPDYKTIPIPTVADKIYDNAKTDTASASIVNDAVKDYVNSGAADVALDTAKADADATHNCGTGTHWSGSACVADTPTTPSTPTTPDTPFDPTSILDAIGRLFDAVMSLPDVINNALDSLLNDIKDFFQPAIDKVNDFVDWVKQEPPQDEAPKNVPVGELSDVGLENQDRFQARIKFPSQCPSQQLTFNYFGRTYSHEIPFQALCQVLEMVAPVFVGVACLGVAFYIVREV